MAILNRRKFLGSASFIALPLLGGLTSLTGCSTETAQAKFARQSNEPKRTEYAKFESNRKTITTPFGQIAYAEYGAGEPALFIHGLGLNSYFWTGQLSGLSHVRRCIAPDLMAHGHTEISSHQGVSFTHQADMLISFLNALNIDKIDIVGNDSGGAIAQILAAKAPDRVRSLVLTNCDVHNNWPPEALKAIKASAPDGDVAGSFAKLLENPEVLRQDGGLAGLVFERPENVSDELIRIFFQPLTQTPEKRAAFNRYVALQDTEQLTRIEADLKKLNAPALILWATDDVFFETIWAYWLEETLPNALPVIEFEGAKLNFPFERPADVNEEILKFWSLT